MQAAIAVTYLVYVIATVLILCLKMDRGLELSSLLPYDTSTYRYLSIYERHFQDYGAPLEVVIANKLEYSDRDTQTVPLIFLLIYRVCATYFRRYSLPYHIWKTRSTH
jgi:hypothetical protein